MGTDRVWLVCGVVCVLCLYGVRAELCGKDRVLLGVGVVGDKAVIQSLVVGDPFGEAGASGENSIDPEDSVPLPDEFDPAEGGVGDGNHCGHRNFDRQISGLFQRKKLLKLGLFEKKSPPPKEEFSSPLRLVLDNRVELTHISSQE